MSNFNCKECGKEYDKLESVRKHRSMVHKMGSEDSYLHYILNDVKPLCECGCGDTPSFKGCSIGYLTYLPGHHMRIKGKNNFQATPESKIKSAATQKAKYASGELVQWNTGLTKDDPRVLDNMLKINTPERAAKISIAHTGKVHSAEHRLNNSKSKIKMYAERPEIIINNLI